MLRQSFMPLLAAIAMALSGCVMWHSHDYVLICSEPLGARIVVDGEDTGQTTPARLSIGGNFGTNHVIELSRKGYRTARRHVYQHTEGYTSKWIDGAYSMTMPPLPFFWTSGDMVFPFAIRSALIPGELYVRLEKEDAPLLGFDLLAAYAAQKGKTPPKNP
jgi:hypothetical protein